MNLIFTKTLVAASLVASSVGLYAAPLDKASQEYAQLQAMGYEIDPIKPSDTWTVAKSMSGKIVVSQSPEGMSFARYFIRERQNLNQEQKLQLLTEINQANIDMSYQMSVGDEYLTVALYYAGPYNVKVFANIVRQLELSSGIFDRYPNLIKLLNK